MVDNCTGKRNRVASVPPYVQLADVAVQVCCRLRHSSGAQRAGRPENNDLSLLVYTLVFSYNCLVLIQTEGQTLLQGAFIVQQREAFHRASRGT